MTGKTTIHIEGPYSFQGANGLEAPVYIFEPGGERKEIGTTKVIVDGGMTFELNIDDEYQDDFLMAGFEVPMRFVAHNHKKVA